MISVIDASLAIKWFIEEPGADQSKVVLTKILEGSVECVVPELFFYEIFSVCTRLHSNPIKFAKEGMELLSNLPIKRYVLTPKMAASAVAFTQRGLSGYDVCYAALATELGGRWLTFDKKAFLKLSKPDWIELFLEN